MLIEINQVQKVKYHMIPLIWQSGRGKVTGCCKAEGRRQGWQRECTREKGIFQQTCWQRLYDCIFCENLQKCPQKDDFYCM